MKKVMFDSEQHPDFTYENNGVGTVKVQVSAANQAFPLEGIEIEISKEINGDEVVFFTGKTNSSGIIDDIYLPAKKGGKNIESANDIIYTTYIITATNPKTDAIKKNDIAVFDGMKIIQPLTFSTIN